MVPLAQRCPDVPEKLVAVVDRALAREPDDRYESCRAMQEDLERFLHGAKAPIGTRDIARLVTDLQAEPTWGRSPPVTPAAPPAPRTEHPPDVPPAPTAVARPMATPFSRETPPMEAARADARPRRLALPIVGGIALGLLLAGGGATAYALRARGKGEPPAQVAPAPAPTVEVHPVEPPKPPVKPAVITVKSRPRLKVRIGEQQGQTPFTAEVEPGEIKIEVFAPESGLSKNETLAVQPGERVIREFSFAKVQVLFRSVPEAKVFVDGQQVHGSDEDDDKTPIRTRIYEGKHQVRFQCDNGMEDRRTLMVAPSSDPLTIDGKCNNDGKD
jgi:serine/threonine-protein kinase